MAGQHTSRRFAHPRRPHPQTACLCAFCTMGGRCGLCKTAVCAKNAGRGLTGRGPGRILWAWQRRRGVFSPAFSFARKSVPVRIPNHSQRGESCFASRARPFSAAVQTPQAPARRRKTKHRGRNSAYDRRHFHHRHFVGAVGGDPRVLYEPGLCLGGGGLCPRQKLRQHPVQKLYRLCRVLAGLYAAGLGADVRRRGPQLL